MNVLSKVYVDLRETLLPVFVATLRILRLDRIARLGVATAKALLPSWPHGGRRIEHPTVMALEDLPAETLPEQEGGQSPQEASTGRLLSPCTVDENGVPTYEAVGADESSKPTRIDEVKFPGVDVSQDTERPTRRTSKKTSEGSRRVVEILKPRLVGVAQGLRAATKDAVESLISGGEDMEENPAEEDERDYVETRTDTQGQLSDEDDAAVRGASSRGAVGTKRKESEEWPSLVEPVSKRPRSIEGEREDQVATPESSSSAVQTPADGFVPTDASRDEVTAPMQLKESSGIERVLPADESISPAHAKEEIEIGGEQPKSSAAANEETEPPRAVRSEQFVPLVEESSGLLVLKPDEAGPGEAVKSPRVEESSGLSVGAKPRESSVRSFDVQEGNGTANALAAASRVDALSSRLEESSGLEAAVQSAPTESLHLQLEESSGLSIEPQINSKQHSETPESGDAAEEPTAELLTGRGRLREEKTVNVSPPASLEESSGLVSEPLVSSIETPARGQVPRPAGEFSTSADDALGAAQNGDDKPLLEESSGLGSAHHGLTIPSPGVDESEPSGFEEQEQLEATDDSKPHVHFAAQLKPQETGASSKPELSLPSCASIFEKSDEREQSPLEDEASSGPATEPLETEESSRREVAVRSRPQHVVSDGEVDRREQPHEPTSSHETESEHDQTPSWLELPSYEEDRETTVGPAHSAPPKFVTPSRPHELAHLLPSQPTEKSNLRETDPIHVLESEVHSLSLVSPAAAASALSMSLFRPKDVSPQHSAYDDIKKMLGVGPQQTDAPRDRGESNGTEDTENDRQLEEIDSDGDDPLKVEIPSSLSLDTAATELDSASSSGDDVWRSDEDEAFAAVPPFLRKRVISAVYYAV